jgi:predicted amidophosphoribosyltransferase
VVIIDDVTTTGATAQAIAERLKKAGVKLVYLITVASTPPVDKY